MINTKENTADSLVIQKYTDLAKSLVCDIAQKKGQALKVYIATFGCQQNEADSERLLGTALMLGYQKTDDIEKADLIIYNTCAVREHAELKALSKTGQLKRLKQNNEYLLVGLWGCMVSKEDRVDEIKHKYPYVDFVAGTNMLHRLSEILCDVLINKRRRFYVDEKDYPMVEGVPVSRQSDIKAYVSIMYGCDNFCT
ncbi:MAG: tRNA (N6-isopentenyl adenosine(37)-C2)-methylthiotransferase MiaB, partial [Clostridia bacterium]|nr:tRNA (N6-isopentenyl adenosine(37)-C2)-methylthiotransferase MiaB [Clostridia bacterium]